MISREELNKIYNQHGFEILPDDVVIKEGDYYQSIGNGLTDFLGNRFAGMLVTDPYHHGKTSEEYQKHSNPKRLYFIRPLPKKQPKQPKIYYKVVRGVSQLFSARSEYSVEYKVNEWTEAPGNTRLFLFDSLEAAKDFKWDNESVYTCYAQHIAIGYGAFSTGTINVFWNFVAEHSKGRHVTKAIAKANKEFRSSVHKAVLARRVKLLEKVG